MLVAETGGDPGLETARQEHSRDRSNARGVTQLVCDLIFAVELRIFGAERNHRKGPSLESMCFLVRRCNELQVDQDSTFMAPKRRFQASLGMVSALTAF